MSRRVALLLVLALLLLLAVFHQARYSYAQVRTLLHPEASLQTPFALAEFGPEVAAVQAPAEEAGLHTGDRIVEVDGAALTGHAVLDAALARHLPGGSLSLRLSDGRNLSIPLVTAPARGHGLLDWSIALVMQVLMPVLCLALGFWVAALRPEDPLAWLLLALLISFGLTTVDRQVMRAATIFRDLDLVYVTLCGMTWPIWMILFGIYFPERLSLDRRWPWAKWLLIAPLSILILATLALQIAAAHSFAAAAPMGRALAPLGRPQQILGMLCISIFFMGLGTKSGMSSAPDARRRLGLLWTGAAVGLTPMFLVALTSLIRGTGMFEGLPPGIVITALLMLFIFPLTLAYVIVVHRALDVRVVIRQGIQYAFARRGMQVLRAALVFGILLAISAVASRPNTRQVDILRILGIGGTAIVLIGVIGERVIRWTDRRFFREALDAERILNDLGEKVRTMVEAAPLLQTVARTISDSLHVPEVVFFLVEGTVCRPVHALGYPVTPVVTFRDDGPVLLRLAEAREPVRVHLDDPKSWVNAVAVPREERESLRELHARLLLPLAVKERITGFISLGPKLSEEPYSGTDLRLLQSVTTHAALALENSRLAAAIVMEVAQRERLNREVEIAREVQERLFPQRLPPVAGLDYSGHCRPALGVGGDYYDFLPLPDGRFGIAIADVSGKGIGAALLMASLQASLRGQTIQTGAIAGLIGNVNRLVYEASPDNRYATFFYGRYDPATRQLGFVNAGHCPPILLRDASGRREVIRLKASGTVIGLFSDSVYEEGMVALRPGDTLVAYTDGISEAQNAADEEWGEDCLIAAAGRCDGISAAESIARLLKEADAFVDGADQYDDMTLVVVKVV